MIDAVTVSTARTPIGKAKRGALNLAKGADMTAHAIRHAVARAGIDPAEVMIGCGYPEGATGGGVESISLVQPIDRALHQNDWLAAHKPAIYMSMIETADIVARRYGVSREAQDRFVLESQRRTAAAQAAGRFDADRRREGGDRHGDQRTRRIAITLAKDEGNRPETTDEGLAKLKPVRGADALAIFRGFAAAGCEPDEMGVGPVFAVPRLLARHGLKVADIDLWEINEAFASQSDCCVEKLDADPARVNVDGDAISIGHPFGMSGARLVGHAALKRRRRGARYAVIPLGVAGGMGAAGLLEINPGARPMDLRRRSLCPRGKELLILEIWDRSANRRPTIAASTWRRSSG